MSWVNFISLIHGRISHTFKDMCEELKEVTTAEEFE